MVTVRCWEAGNGLEAVDLYQEHHPALVTMDITMPEMDRIAAIKKSWKVNPNANIIVCSALGQKEGWLWEPFPSRR